MRTADQYCDLFPNWLHASLNWNRFVLWMSSRTTRAGSALYAMICTNSAYRQGLQFCKLLAVHDHLQMHPLSKILIFFLINGTKTIKKMSSVG
ncbi:NADH dehydrogenase [Trichinella spiralis]|uniref:NADH dehydrogenase n=1 Tax=Trichinella spiralis TaxID=6334 RepID=A0ABR3KET4_TRISP